MLHIAGKTVETRVALPIAVYERAGEIIVRVRTYDLRHIGNGFDPRTLIGAVAAIACFLGYNTSKQFSKHKEQFGKGSIEGVAGSEAANNAVTGGSLIPTLTLGIPGESVTAVLMGGLVIQGLAPGPELFGKYAPMTYTFFAGFVLVQFFMLGIGLLGCRGFAQISRLSDAILIPCVTVLCCVGSYAIHKNILDIVVMMSFGVLGYFMRKLDLNTAAVVLALILGPIGEKGLRNALKSSGGDPAILFSSVVSWVLIAPCIVGILVHEQAREEGREGGHRRHERRYRTAHGGRLRLIGSFKKNTQALPVCFF